MALKRQQAAEDVIAIGLRAVATGSSAGYLPPGPIFGMSVTSPKPDEAASLSQAANKSSTKSEYSSSAGSDPEDNDSAAEDEETGPGNLLETKVEQVRDAEGSLEAVKGDTCQPEPKRKRVDSGQGAEANNNNNNRHQEKTWDYKLTPIEILSRIFPGQKRSVLQLVLQGCKGDLIRAIEHFLSSSDFSQPPAQLMQMAAAAASLTRAAAAANKQQAVQQPPTSPSYLGQHGLKMREELKGSAFSSPLGLGQRQGASVHQGAGPFGLHPFLNFPDLVSPMAAGNGPTAGGAYPSIPSGLRVPSLESLSKLTVFIS